MALYLLVLIIAATFTTSTYTATGARPQVEQGKPSTTALEFLRARCSTIEPDFVNECYKFLLPDAESFHNSQIKVIGAAATIMITNFQKLQSEARHLNSTATGYTLGGCISLAEATINESKEWLPKLIQLEALGDEKVKEQDLDGIKKRVEKLPANFNEGCAMDIGNIENIIRDLPTDVVMYESISVFVGLLNGYKPLNP